MRDVPGLIEEVQQVLRRVDPDGVLVACEVRDVHIGPSELARVADEVDRLLGRGGEPPSRLPTVLLVMDRTVIRRAGSAVKDELVAQLAQRFDLRTLVLDDGHAELHASDEVIDSATAAADGVDAIVSVGGGTISDIGKLSSVGVGGLPLVVVQTAASVDGFTDNVSVVLRHGVKRTVPSRWPDVVVADTTLIAEAPQAMNRAGFGEINSMFTAPADWRLANLLGFDESFHHGPIALLAEVGDQIEEWSRGLATGQRNSTERLVRALGMRGIATGVAGTTACLSGVEHLISHMLDISNAANGRPTGLHGAQVGVGSVVAAAAWELLFARMDAASTVPGPELTPPDPAAAEQLVRAQFGPLDPTGALAEECWRDYHHKLGSWTRNRLVVLRVLSRWELHRQELRSLVRTPEEIAIGLQASGSPARFGDLDPAVESALARWAVQYCGLMRNRFTVVDLLTFLGWWQDADVTEVMARAETACTSTASRS